MYLSDAFSQWTRIGITVYHPIMITCEDPVLIPEGLSTFPHVKFPTDIEA